MTPDTTNWRETWDKNLNLDTGRKLHTNLDNRSYILGIGDAKGVTQTLLTEQARESSESYQSGYELGRKIAIQSCIEKLRGMKKDEIELKAAELLGGLSRKSGYNLALESAIKELELLK